MSLIEQRLEKLKERLVKESLDGMLVTNLTNVHYLSGFTGSAGTCLILPDKNYFISDGRYLTQSKEQVKGMDIVIDVDPHLEIIKKKTLLKNGLKLGIEADSLPVSQMEKLKEFFPSCKWESTTRFVEEIAAVKDKGEIRAIRTAVEITDQVFEQIVPEIREGITEKEIAAKISYAILMMGGDGDAFSPIVAGGPNSALPHAMSGDRKFRSGDFIVLDFGARYRGYHADMTRTVVVKEASDRHKEIYDIVLEAQRRGIAAAKDGVSCKEVDSACRNYIAENGYGDFFVHGTGHGLGLEIHTMPKLSQTSKDVVLENYVITIEPGIYIPEFGGVRIEDDVLVKRDGYEIFNQTPKELIVTN